MGLDMYLTRKHYVGNKHRKPEQRLKLRFPKSEDGVFLPIKKDAIKTENISYIEEEVMYWRKANHIHKWFVDNCQDGIDECQYTYVPRAKLEQLLDLCERVIQGSKLVKGKTVESIGFEKDATTGQLREVPNLVDGQVIEDPTLAKELLPTQEGFFFGATDYDDWYYEDTKRTAEVLREALKDESADHFIYHASW